MNAASFPNDLTSSHAVIQQHLAVINELTLKSLKQAEEIQQLQQRVAWFERQIFGAKSERRITDDSAKEQLHLGEQFEGQQRAVSKPVTVKEYSRKAREAVPTNLEDERGLRFDESVPVEDQPVLLPPEVQGKDPAEYEVIRTDVNHVLAQRPGAYFVKRFFRPVIKLKESGKFLPVVSVPTVLERSYADVTLLAGILENKFLYYLPLYRQFQMILNSGIKLSRATLTNYVHRTALLLEPVYAAQLVSALRSEILAMDETPLLAGLSETKAHSMHQGYVWALYGELGEPTFVYAASRAKKELDRILGGSFKGKLLSDGYAAYAAYAKGLERQIVLARCWAHARREFFEALMYEPVLCNPALDYIKQLYEIEARIKDAPPDKRLKVRDRESRPIVDSFFDWLRKEQLRQVLLPSNPFLKAAAYALGAEAGLRVFLGDPALPIDNNQLERTLRPVPMGRKNWMFCWTELGAKVVAIIQSLVSTCRVQGVRPFDYFVDVLPRLDSTPMSQVADLTPRVWAAQQKAKA